LDSPYYLLVRYYMNKRITELAVEAGMIVGEYNGFDMTRLMPKERRFAELIVRECVAQCEKNAEHPYLGPGSKLSAFNIREHFGVEELPVCKHDWYSAKNPVVKNGSICVICGAIDAREPEELKNERTN